MRGLKAMALATALTAGSAFSAEVAKGVEISGFIDMSYVSTSPDNGTDTTTMAMDQAEIDLALDLGSGLSARIDLEAVAGTATAMESVYVEQARVDYKVTDMFTLTMGKFDTIIGFEALEPVDMYQYSHSLTWELEPTYHTGLLGIYDAGTFNVGLGLVNSLRADSNPDTNDEMSYILHAGITPMEGLAVNLNYAAGNENPGASGDATASTASEDVTLLELDVSYQMNNLLVAFEYVSAETDNAGTTSEDTGMMLMANYAFSEKAAVTLRYSQNEGKTGDAASEITISPSYAITDNWGILFEYRTNSQDASYTGTPKPGEGSVMAIETTVSF